MWLFPFYRRENSVLERESNLPKLTCQDNRCAGWGQTFWAPAWDLRATAVAGREVRPLSGLKLSHTLSPTSGWVPGRGLPEGWGCQKTEGSGSSGGHPLSHPHVLQISLTPPTG